MVKAIKIINDVTVTDVDIDMARIDTNDVR